MSKKFHVNLATGETSECHAEIKCRLNGLDEEPHFDTEAQAKEAYAQRMEPELFPNLTKASANKPFESDLEAALSAPNLVKKPVEDKSAFASMNENESPAESAFSNADIAQFASSYYEESKLYKFVMDEATDEQSNLVLDSANARSALNRIVAASSNPNTSPATRIKALKTSACFNLTEKMVKSDGFPTKALVDHMSLIQRKDAASFTNDPESIDEIVKSLEVRNGRVYTFNAEIATAAFNNPVTSFKTKSYLVQLDPRLNSLMRVQESMASSPRKFDGLLKGNSESGNSTVGKDSIIFDTEKVRDLAWGPNEVQSYVKNVLKRDSLDSGYYNAETGEYTMYRD